MYSLEESERVDKDVTIWEEGDRKVTCHSGQKGATRDVNAGGEAAPCLGLEDGGWVNSTGGKGCTCRAKGPAQSKRVPKDAHSGGRGAHGWGEEVLGLEN